MKKFALILGITGQDGSYLSELLLEKEYKVWGIIRRASNFNTQRIEHIRDLLTLKYGDITDQTCLVNILREIEDEEPDELEVYNLAAQSHVKVSFEMPNYTSQVDGLGTLNILEAIRLSPLKDITKFYQASTSELYGKVQEVPQSEKTPFYPRSPYGVAKLYSYWIVKNYRESYNMFACNGILFNHSSPRRPENFILKKITSGVQKLLTDPNFTLKVGNLDAKRDIGYAKEYCLGMWMMLQHHEPDDFVLATGLCYSIRELIVLALGYYDVSINWMGSGDNERGVCPNSGRVLVEVDKRYYRPCEVDLLVGDASKARLKLNWEPITDIYSLIEKMLTDE